MDNPTLHDYNVDTRINDFITYVKNQDKWESANKFAEHKGWKFQIWTEETLKNLGIKLLTGKHK